MSTNPQKEGPSGPSPLWNHVYSGTQLAVSVLLGVFAGYMLDKRWATSPWLLLLGSALGLAAGLYGFLKPFLFRGGKGQ